MAAADPYRFRRSGRSPLTWAAAGLCLCGIALTSAAGAPWFAYLPIGIALLEAVRQLVLNPVTGIDIDGSAIVLHQRGRQMRHPLAGIDHVVFDSWTDSVDVTLHLRDGTRVPLSSRALPPSGLLRRELESRGLAVVNR